MGTVLARRYASRETVLAGALTKGASTDAFSPEREVRLRLLDASGAPALGRAELERAAHALVRLARAVARASEERTWLASYGRSPEELVTDDELEPVADVLEDALGGTTPDEEFRLLAHLAGRGRRTDVLTFEPKSLVRLRGRGGRLLLARRLADPREVGEVVPRLRFHGGHGLPFWIADATLGVRFSVEGDDVAIKAHHPLLQAELVAACERAGVELQ